MIRYLHVFFRFKVPLIGLMALCMAVSTIVVMVQPRTYQATANLWFDHGPIPNPSPMISSETPADQANSIFHELLNSHDFDIAVGRRGPLASYYDTTGNFPSSDPITPLVHWIEGRPAPTGDTRQALVDNGVTITLQKYVLVTPIEPNEVGLSFDFSDPTIAAGTLKAFIDQFEEQVKATALVAAQGSRDFYSQQVQAQTKAVADADAAVANYLAAHPSLGSPFPPPDATFAGLREADDLARQQLATLTKELDQANLDVAAIQAPGPYGFRIIDAPKAPLSPTGLLKTVLLGFGGGLGVSLLLIGVICFLLVSADDSITRGRDLQRILGLRVIGEVPLVSEAVIVTPPPKRKALPGKAF